MVETLQICWVPLKKLNQSLPLFYLKKQAENHLGVPETMGVIKKAVSLHLHSTAYGSIFSFVITSQYETSIQQAFFANFFIGEGGLDERKIVKVNLIAFVLFCQRM